MINSKLLSFFLFIAFATAFETHSSSKMLIAKNKEILKSQGAGIAGDV
jgi:hypothetical protein